MDDDVLFSKVKDLWNAKLGIVELQGLACTVVR